MIHYFPNNAETLKPLQAVLRILRDPENWYKGDMKHGDAYCINGALYVAGNIIANTHRTTRTRFRMHLKTL